MAPVQLEGIIELLQSSLGELISGVLNPSIGLHKHSGTQVLVGIPPVRGARGGAARAQDALIHAVKLLSVLLGLQKLSVVQVVAALYLGLQPGLDGLVLVVEVGHVRHQVLDDIHVRKGVDLHGLAGLVDEAQAGEGVTTVDIHGAAATDTLTARPSEGERGVLLVLDLQQSIKNHWSTVVQVHGVGGGVWLLFSLGIPSVNLEIPVNKSDGDN